MSHLSKIRTVLTDLRWLKLALADLQCTYDEGALFVKRGQEQMPVSLKIVQSPQVAISGELGFKSREEELESVADWHGRDGVVNKKFLDTVTQRYAYHAIREKMEEQGFRLDEERLEKNGREIHLVLRRSS